MINKCLVESHKFLNHNEVGTVDYDYSGNGTLVTDEIQDTFEEQVVPLQVRGSWDFTN